MDWAGRLRSIVDAASRRVRRAALDLGVSVAELGSAASIRFLRTGGVLWLSVGTILKIGSAMLDLL